MPIWLLDIDGVINALSRDTNPTVWPDDQWILTEAVSAEDIEWPLRVASPVVDFLRNIHEQGRAEIWWHTSWQQHAQNVGVALGLPEFPVLECPEYDMGWAEIAVPLTKKLSRWWKLPAAQRVIAEGRPVLWTDDDLHHQLDKADVAAWGNQVLTVSPAAPHGLTKRLLRRIDTWLAAYPD